jgi:hypothetical protein
LEDRLAPATFSAALTAGTLVITQTSAAVLDIQVSDNSALGVVAIDDHGDANLPSYFATAGRPSLAIRLQPADTTAVAYYTDTNRAGSVSLLLANTAARTLNLGGGATIGGSLTVTGGNGGLTVMELAALHVAKNATFRGGTGLDVLDLSSADATSVGGTLSMVRFNTIRSQSDSVGRLTFNAAGDATYNSLHLTGTKVLGSLIYVGGNGGDDIAIEYGAEVSGQVGVNFGSQLPADMSFFWLDQNSRIGGRITATGGSSGRDRVDLMGTVDGAVTVNLGGGENELDARGLFNSSMLAYTGGSGVDTLIYTLRDGSTRARFSARLGDGADSVTFGTPTVNPLFAFIDFGAGTDTFSGTVNFSCQFLNLS